ncbi:MAG TPA: alanine dehydrogenase [Dehalococcoidia bacterium]|nr:alanine dehydrogenase [Dehalococcoidia bacterium]
MIVGTVRELKTEEHRVGLTPEGARDLVRLRHRVLVEAGAGAGSGFTDAAYAQIGAEVVATAAEVWAAAELIVKVKEPQTVEFGLLRRDQTLFTYLHLAAEPEVTNALLSAGTTAIAYETVELPDGSLPLLIPMSQIAGRMAPLVAARWLQHPGPGRGKLLSGLPGAPAARVVIFGAGTVATNACDVAVALGARVTVLARRLDQLRALEDRWPNRLTTLPSSPANIERAIEGADVLISGVLARGGATAPKLVDRDALKRVGPGGVIVDVAIDQGGSFETSRETTHSDPVFVEEGVVHYCVANMPGAVPHTSTNALTAATLAYVLSLAEKGAAKALADDASLARGLMTRNGELVNRSVAEALHI